MKAMIQKYKVCMLVHQDYYIDARVMQYAKALSKSGCTVDVICTKSEAPGHPEIDPMINVYPIPFIHHQGSFTALFFEYLLAFPFYIIFMLMLYIKNHYTVIHFHNMPDFLVFCGLIPKMLGAKIILDIHDPMPEIYLSKYRDKPNHGILELILFEEKISCSITDAIITANPFFQDALVRRGINYNKITVILNQPDPSVFNRMVCTHKERADISSYRLIYPGTMAPRYGLDFAIKAMPVLVQKIPQIRLIIIGPMTEYSNDLQKLIDELRLQNWVEIRPAIPIAQIPEELCVSDVGIYPAMPDEHMSVAIPGKVIEFVVMGLPVIASRLRILERYLPEEAIRYFTPGDSSNFIRSVIELYENPGLREQIVKNADKMYLTKHNIEVEEQRYYYLLDQLSENTNRRYRNE